MKKCIYLAPLLFFAISFTSCVENIDLDTGERIPNVYCILNNGPEQSLDLSYIASSGEESRPIGEDVTISLYEDNTPAGNFARVSETRWALSFTPHGGKDYRIEVNISGKEVLTAKTTYPLVSNLQSVYFANAQGEILPTNGFELNSDKDQILWCYFESEYESPVFSQYILTDHPGLDTRGETIYPFDQDDPIIEAEFHSNSRDDKENEWWFTTSKFSSMFSGRRAFLHERFLRVLHPAGFSRPVDPNEFRIFSYRGGKVSFETVTESGAFFIAGVNRSHIRAELVLLSVSEEYDKYLSEFCFQNDDDDVFTALAYKRNHFSNIINGTGIFGACHEYREGFYSSFDNPIFLDF